MSPLKTKGHYQLKGGSSIPNVNSPIVISLTYLGGGGGGGGGWLTEVQYEGVLYKNFTRQGQDCGGNCGGTSLKYNGKPYGSWPLDPSAWFVVPHPRIAGAYLVSF